MFTRKDYLSKVCTHREYYAQFVNARITQAVEHRIGIERLKASTDEHLNDIPLSEWDGIIWAVRLLPTSTKMKEAGDYLTMASNTCIAKEAARQLIEANQGEGE